MKKMIFALVAMVMMTMSANAQSIDNNSKLTFDRLASYQKAMAQFESSMEAVYQVENASKAGEAWETIQARHKQKMRKILSEKQYNKYVKTLDLTAKNTAERIMDQQLASK